MRKGMKRAVALALAAMLTGGVAVVPVSAQEAGEYIPEVSAPVEEYAAPVVTGIKETLQCSRAEKDMDWDFFSENGGSADWYSRMGFPEYALNLYGALENTSMLSDDGSFSADTAYTTTYSDGSSDVYNGFEVLYLDNASRMSDEEWGEIKENLCETYVAFKRDYPGVFWLGDTPEIIRVATSETLETGEEIFSYQVYFVLKDHNNNYDLRDSKYQSAEAINAAVEQRDQSVRSVFDETGDKNMTEMITYFRDKANAVAGSMGLGKEGKAYGFKLLCNEAGITCVIAPDASGSMESYVLLGDTWYKADDVTETMDVVEEPTQLEENDSKTGDTSEDKKDGEDGEESEEEKKSDSIWNWTIGKSSRTAAAAPAFKSPALKSAMAAANTAKALGIEFYLNDVKIEEDVLADTLKEVLIDPQKDEMIYGNRLIDMLPFKNTINYPSEVNGESYGIKVKDASGKEMTDVKFQHLLANNRPNAREESASNTYTVRCFYEIPGEGDVPSTSANLDVITEPIPEVRPRDINADVSGLEYIRTYGTDTYTAKDSADIGLGTPLASASN